MRRSMVVSGWAICAALVGASAANAGPRDPLYQWTDASGVIRYTSEIDRIPDDQRGAAVTVAAERAPGQPAELPVTPRPADPVDPSATTVDSAPPPGAAVAPSDPRLVRLDARIAELERLIAADEAALGDYISDPERTAQKSDAADVAAIADRLPKLQNELRELRELRKQGETAAQPAAPDAAAPPN